MTSDTIPARWSPVPSSTSFRGVSGEILEVGFKDGGVVRKGQTLYKLDPVPVRSRRQGSRGQHRKVQGGTHLCPEPITTVSICCMKSRRPASTHSKAPRQPSAPPRPPCSPPRQNSSPQRTISKYRHHRPPGGNRRRHRLYSRQLHHTEFRYAAHHHPDSADAGPLFHQRRRPLQHVRLPPELMKNGSVEVKLADGS